MTRSATPISAPPVTHKNTVPLDMSTPIFDAVAGGVPLPEPVDAEFHWRVVPRPPAQKPVPGARPARPRKKSRR